MYNFTNPVQYHLTRSGSIGNLSSDFQKILDYLITFVGEVQVRKEKEGLAMISYTNIPFQSSLKTYSNPNAKEKIISNQITLTCEKEDNLSVQLIKNVSGNIGYRIFNAQTKSYLVNDPNIIDLTQSPINENIYKIFKSYKLAPFLQYRDSLIFFSKDNKGQIHLSNKYLLEHLIENPTQKLYLNEFSVVVASDIGRFIALFDRGLISYSFHKHIDDHKKIINFSGFNIDKLQRELNLYPVYFNLDLENQTFNQVELVNLPQKIEIKKGASLISVIGVTFKKFKTEYLAVKIAQDVRYIESKGKLVPKLAISVFFDNE